ncbi:hypothetical protein [Candidatus Xianfuyuplasma coldseepsis]|uniref:Uncharacterized protein n=1 Tax=Candidatus Xianfuyuplasma coldseepsis TaxID=2782163 RepID=A0A7L7KQN2_9MOLU|nr:hypothetical protein [Xianfuyuplasma coldseepsis]QMS85033.1 hypothetical protein G4Z02_04445 [Xianfuyuplasma coldseepsis]
MRQYNHKYNFKQLEPYKEILELQHIRIKTLIVNILNVVFAFVVLYFFIRLQVETIQILQVMFMFGLLLLINIYFMSLNHDLYNNLKLAMYTNALGEFIIALTLIFMFQTPSIFTSLFLAYAITSIYQDYKVMFISNGALFVSGILLAINYQVIFSIPNVDAIQNLYVVVFLLLFVLLLTLSSYILIKRKSFFYNHLAKIKESEVRNMDLLMEIQTIRTSHEMDVDAYYKSLDTFTKELSKKIGIENVFGRKIQLLKDMKKEPTTSLLEKYPEYTLEQLNELSNLELSIHHKMRNIGLKASKTKDIDVNRKEIFSESQFKSFRHFNDDTYVKIISFVVFYVMLRMDKIYLSELSQEDVVDILFNSEYYYLIDEDVLRVFKENSEVFEMIIQDVLKDAWGHEKHI